MKCERWGAAVAVGALVAALAGCGGSSGPKYVKVSGVLKVDGKPYPKGVLSFQPIGSTKNPNPGRGSTAYTDENGRYVLKTDDGTVGAVPGKHNVRIMTRFGESAPVDPNVGSADGDAKAPSKAPKEIIPREWFTDGKEFTVPPEGTDKLDFDIETKPGKKK